MMRSVGKSLWILSAFLWGSSQLWAVSFPVSRCFQDSLSSLMGVGRSSGYFPIEPHKIVEGSVLSVASVGRSTPLKVRKITPDTLNPKKLHVLMRDLDGQAKYFSVLPQGKGAKFIEESPLLSPLSRIPRNPLVVEKNFHFRNHPRLVEEIAYSHLTSSSFSQMEEVDSAKMLKAFQKAVRVMVDQLRRGTPLKDHDVSFWNRLLVQADERQYLNAGHLRGTFLRGRDLRKSDVYVTTAAPGFPYVSVVSPSEVPLRFAQLLEEINRIGPHSPLEDIARLQREFLTIHPYMDGNGRTSRMLLDYMLMKAHFPPLPHTYDETRVVLFHSAEEIVDEWKQVYRRKNERLSP